MEYGWRPYVPVAQRRRNAEREIEKLFKKMGTSPQPVVIKGRKIATTFWGKAWCDNLESYSDFENRLPRGRAYVRNGSVCHLEIAEGVVRAKVSGSKLYTVTINIKPLGAKAWNDITNRCTGKIASLLDLLGGKLADGVMEIVTDRKNGLFPKPSEISMNCSCPDWATMCKHVAAVLYGVGARLDERPELLFLLRGVNHLDLISATVEDAVASVVKGGSRRRIATSKLSEVFGIDVDAVEAAPAGAARKAPVSKPEPVAKKPKAPVRGGRSTASDMAPAFPEEITGAQIRSLRVRLGLTAKDFAVLLGVSGGAISVWERNSKKLNLQDRSRKALEKVWNASGKPKRGH